MLHCEINFESEDTYLSVYICNIMHKQQNYTKSGMNRNMLNSFSQSL